MSAGAATGPRPGAEHRPRLVRGLAVVRRADGLVVEGVTRRQVFAGAAATELLPRLFERLDGEHDITALTTATGVRRPEIVRALRLLDRGGLLEWVRPDRAGLARDPADLADLALELPDRLDPALDLARDLAPDRSVRSDPARDPAVDPADLPNPALDLLDLPDRLDLPDPAHSADRSGPVLDPASDAYLSRSLSPTRRHTEVRTVAAALADARVTVVGVGPLAYAVVSCLRESGVTCAVRGTGVPAEPQRLVVVCEQEPAEFVPLAAELWRRGTPVLRFAGDGERLELGPFFHPRWTSCPHCWSLAAEAATGGALPADAVELAAGLICAEALALLSMITPPVTVSRVVRVTLARMREEVLVLGPEPGCARCFPEVPEADGLTAARYERTAAWSPWTERPSGASELTSRIESQYEASPKLPLDRLPQYLRLLLTEPVATQEVDVYLLGVPGSAHPVHLYDPVSGQLVATRASADPVPLGLPGEPAAVLVLVAAPVRLYADRGAEGHRSALIRAGVTLAQMHRAAAGCRLQVTTRCDPALRELLELRTDQEVPAVVVGVYEEAEHATGD